MAEVVPQAETVINGAAKETADTAAGVLEAAAFVEFYQRMLTVEGKRSTPPSYLAHE